MSSVQYIPVNLKNDILGFIAEWQAAKNMFQALETISLLPRGYQILELATISSLMKNSPRALVITSEITQEAKKHFELREWFMSKEDVEFEKFNFAFLS